MFESVSASPPVQGQRIRARNRRITDFDVYGQAIIHHLGKVGQALSQYWPSQRSTSKVFNGPPAAPRPCAG